MAESVADVGKALRAGVSFILHYGGNFLLEISTDNVEVINILSSTTLQLGALLQMKDFWKSLQIMNLEE